MKTVPTSSHLTAAALAAILGLSLAACETETAGLPGRRPARAVASPTIASSPMHETLGPDTVFPIIQADLPQKKGEPIRIRSAFDDLNRLNTTTQPATQPTTRPTTPPPEERHGTINLIPTGTRPADK